MVTKLSHTYTAAQNGTATHKMVLQGTAPTSSTGPWKLTPEALVRLKEFWEQNQVSTFLQHLLTYCYSKSLQGRAYLTTGALYLLGKEYLGGHVDQRIAEMWDFCAEPPAIFEIAIVLQKKDQPLLPRLRALCTYLFERQSAEPYSVLIAQFADYTTMVEGDIELPLTEKRRLRIRFCFEEPESPVYLTLEPDMYGQLHGTQDGIRAALIRQTPLARLEGVVLCNHPSIVSLTWQRISTFAPEEIAAFLIAIAPRLTAEALPYALVKVCDLCKTESLRAKLLEAFLEPTRKASDQPALLASLETLAGYSEEYRAIVAWNKLRDFKAGAQAVTHAELLDHYNTFLKILPIGRKGFADFVDWIAQRLVDSKEYEKLIHLLQQIPVQKGDTVVSKWICHCIEVSMSTNPAAVFPLVSRLKEASDEFLLKVLKFLLQTPTKNWKEIQQVRDQIKGQPAGLDDCLLIIAEHSAPEALKRDWTGLAKRLNKALKERLGKALRKCLEAVGPSREEEFLNAFSPKSGLKGARLWLDSLYPPQLAPPPVVKPIPKEAPKPAPPPVVVPVVKEPPVPKPEPSSAKPSKVDTLLALSPTEITLGQVLDQDYKKSLTLEQWGKFFALLKERTLTAVRAWKIWFAKHPVTETVQAEGPFWVAAIGKCFSSIDLEIIDAFLRNHADSLISKLSTKDGNQICRMVLQRRIELGWLAERTGKKSYEVLFNIGKNRLDLLDAATRVKLLLLFAESTDPAVQAFGQSEFIKCLRDRTTYGRSLLESYCERSFIPSSPENHAALNLWIDWALRELHVNLLQGTQLIDILLRLSFPIDEIFEKWKIMLGRIGKKIAATGSLDAPSTTYITLPEFNAVSITLIDRLLDRDIPATKKEVALLVFAGELDGYETNSLPGTTAIPNNPIWLRYLYQVLPHLNGNTVLARKAMLLIPRVLSPAAQNDAFLEVIRRLTAALPPILMLCENDPWLLKPTLDALQHLANFSSVMALTKNDKGEEEQLWSNLLQALVQVKHSRTFTNAKQYYQKVFRFFGPFTDPASLKMHSTLKKDAQDILNFSSSVILASFIRSYELERLEPADWHFVFASLNKSSVTDMLGFVNDSRNSEDFLNICRLMRYSQFYDESLTRDMNKASLERSPEIFPEDGGALMHHLYRLRYLEGLQNLLAHSKQTAKLSDLTSSLIDRCRVHIGALNHDFLRATAWIIEPHDPVTDLAQEILTLNASLISSIPECALDFMALVKKHIVSEETFLKYSPSIVTAMKEANSELKESLKEMYRGLLLQYRNASKK